MPTVLLAASEANFPKSDRNYVSWKILNAFRQECRARSIRLIPEIEKGDKITPEHLVKAIAQHKPQGVAIMQFDTTELIDAVHDLDPSIVILSGQDPSMRVDTVSPGNRFAARLAVDYLFRLGHTRVAHVTYGQRQIGQLRKQGFLDAYRASPHRIPRGAIIEVETFRSDVVAANMADWLQAQPRPLPFTAFFCSADNVAIGVMTALAKAGLNVPEDVSVLGFDNVEIGSRQVPPLSTVHVPMEEIGHAALNLLEEARTMPKNLRSARRVELGCKIVVRGSTAGPL
ncbi:Transcriptional regulator, LacI family [Candidatus Rhodobacter oscarellae]|uniref:Transcriptional regulator, LacI family n=1 Tax=Candidatus Rhodobacter oscarellae TaxID=1675527 RepID=A0A0J9E2D2_9RHOB|nr:Transcriptional regulator, LacI family [Candidatus Rhodobacter lobularis]